MFEPVGDGHGAVTDHPRDVRFPAEHVERRMSVGRVSDDTARQQRGQRYHCCATGGHDPQVDGQKWWRNRWNTLRQNEALRCKLGTTLTTATRSLEADTRDDAKQTLQSKNRTWRKSRLRPAPTNRCARNLGTSATIGNGGGASYIDMQRKTSRRKAQSTMLGHLGNIY